MSDPTVDLAHDVPATPRRELAQMVLNVMLAHRRLPGEGDRVEIQFAIADALLASGLVSVNPKCSTCGGTGTWTQGPSYYTADDPTMTGPCLAGCVNGRVVGGDR